MVGVFTAGNLLTLGIVILILVLFRGLDRRNNRPLDTVRKYAEHLKKDLSSHADQQAAAVKDYSLALEVEKKSALELMKRLQISDQEWSDKAAAMAKIDERISAYDSSLEELVKMTARVQENLARVREESSFVEATGKQIAEARERMAGLEKNIQGLEMRFQRENTEALEKTGEMVIAAVRSTVSDLEASTEVIERRVDDYREAINKVEQERMALLDRDMEAINRALNEAVEKAGIRADKLEDATLNKLKDQAQERILRVKNAMEEKLNALQDNAKIRMAEIQETLAAQRQEWKSAIAGLDAAAGAKKQELVQTLAALNGVAEKQKESLNAAFAAQREEWAHARKASEGEAKARLDAWEARLEEFGKSVMDLEENAKTQRQKWLDQTAEIENLVMAQRQSWTGIASDLDAALDAQWAKTNAVIAAQQKRWEEAAAGLDTIIAGVEKQALDRIQAKEQELVDSLSAFDRLEEKQKETLEAAIASQMERWKEAAMDLDTAMDAQREKMDAVIADLISAQEQKWKDAAVGLDSAAWSKKREISEIMTTFDGMAEKQRESLGAAIEAQRAEWSHTLEELENETRSRQAAWETKLEEFGKTIAELEEASQAQRQKWLEHAAKLEESSKSQQQSWLDRTADIESLVLAQRQSWTEIAAELDGAALAQRESLEEIAQSQRRSWGQMVKEVESLVLAQQQKWKDAVAALDAGLAAQREKMSAAITGAERDALEAIEAKKEELTEALAAFDGIAERQRESLDEVFAAQAQKWKDVVRELDVTITAQRDKTDIAIAAQEQKWREATVGLDNAIAGVEKQARESIEAKQREVSEALASFDRIAGEQREALDAALAAQWDKMDATIADMVFAQQQKWKDAAAELEAASGEKKRELADALAAFNGAAEEHRNSLEALFDTQRQKWAGIAAGLEGSLAGIESQARELIEAKKRELGETMASFDGIAENQKESLDKALSEHWQKWLKSVSDIDGLVSSQRQKWEDAAVELDAAISGAERRALENLEEKKRELSEALAAFNGAAEDQRDSLEAVFDTQRQKWVDTAAELGEALAGAERQARELIETKKRELSEALNTFSSIAEKQKDSLDTGFAGQEQKWKDAIAAMDSALSAQRQKWADAAAGLEEIFAAQREKTEAAMADAERQLLEDTEGRFEEYRAAQAEELKQLNDLAGDVVRLEDELRRIMAEAEDRARSEFARFREESVEAQAGVAASFDAQVKSLRNSFNAVGQELDALKNRAYDNVSEKLKVFEDDFFAGLSKRGEDIERRLADWQKTMESRLAEMAENSEEERRKLELSHTEKLRKNLAEQGERLMAELERLRDDTAVFEEGIREGMQAADETRASFRQQLDRDLEELRASAEASVKVEIGQYALTTAETLRKRQRELEEQLKAISSFQENRNGELVEFMDLTRKNIEDWLAECGARQEDIDRAIGESRSRMKELETENGERIVQIRTALEKIQGESGALRQEIFAHTREEAKNLDTAIAEAEQHIRDFTAQTRLFDRTDELKQELARSIEDLKGDIDRLDQRKSEVAQMETEFSRVRRLADDVNAKMARFAIEQGRIEVMEKDVDRLLQTSRSVEEKLAQVLNTDDTLEALQVQIRRLEEALKETEEKYQRIERKNQTLEETSSSIARNFQALQDSEAAIRRINEELDRLITEMRDIKSDIEILSGDGERARNAAEKLNSLDDSLLAIEKRIAQMQTAREWVARAETRLGELNKEVQDKFKLIEAVLKDDGAPAPPRDKGAPSLGMRENVIKLARQGWTAKEIAANLKISVGEVELILELAPRDDRSSSGAHPPHRS